MIEARPRRLASAAGTLLLVSMSWPVVAADPAPAGGTGELWEVTSQMSMPGMPMALPPQKSQVCAPKEWKEPPAAADAHRKCVNSDFKLAGSKATWKVHCEGPPAMDGDAEITRNGDTAYAGTIKFTSTEANMLLKLDGKRIGTCDPAKK
jgi:hypothetical protein